MKHSKKPVYSCIESFSGAGGLALGLKRAGFHLIIAFDNDPIAVESFNGYHGKNSAFTVDAHELTGKFLISKNGIRKELDLFAGGPPCQGFSRQKKGAHLGDSRNDLVLEYARLVKELKPRFFCWKMSLCLVKSEVRDLFRK